MRKAVLLALTAAFTLAGNVLAKDDGGGSGGAGSRVPFDAFGAVPGRLETEQKAQILASVLEYRIAELERKVAGMQKQITILHAKLKESK